MTPKRLVAQAACATLMIGGLSLVAQERQPDAATFVVLSAAVDLADVAPPAALLAAPLSEHGPRFVLDGPGSPVADGRGEALTRGTFAATETPYLRLTVTDGPVEPMPALFVTLVRRAAEGASLFVARTGERGRIDSPFGPLETLETTLTALSDGEGSRICTGFATRPPATVRIDGWLCAPLGRAPEPRAIACALDKLILDKSGRNGQALPDGADAMKTVARAKARHDPDCMPAAGQTGSIGRSRGRNEAGVRRNTQAKP